jgi:hypothetical protein
MISKRGVLIGAIFLTIVVLLGMSFYYTGGVGLVRLYRHYLSQDIADKKYAWQDFTDRGATTKLSGYYAGRIGDNIYIWTLSGLRRFGYIQGVSAYYYMDVCGIVRQAAPLREATYSPEVYFDPVTFSAQMKRGDYVGLTRLAEEREVVSQLYGSSNQYYPLTQLRSEQCSE